MQFPAYRGTVRLVATLVVALALAAACASTPPSASPATPPPTPVVTPDPHLVDPATADQVFLALGAAGLRLTANNAGSGPADGPLVKRINATFLGWPLTVTQYRTTAALQGLTEWSPDARPGQGDPPIAIAGFNVLIEWGPTTGAQPKEPSGLQVQGLVDLATTLNVLLSPLRARSVVAIPGLVPAPSSPSPASGGPSGEASPATETTPAP